MDWDRTIRFATESLARTVDRRKFIKGAGNVLFASLATLAAGRVAQASDKTQSVGSAGINCAPPGPYCNLNGVNEPNGCRGSRCYQHMFQGQALTCKVYYAVWQYGCWTVSTGNGGHWTCCDCECFNAQGGGRRTCGCAQYNAPGQPPSPLPDKPSNI